MNGAGKQHAIAPLQLTPVLFTMATWQPCLMLWKLAGGDWLQLNNR